MKEMSHMSGNKNVSAPRAMEGLVNVRFLWRHKECC